MKQLFVAALFMVSALTTFAQDEEPAKEKDEEEKHGFKKENLFTGGNLNLSFFNGVTVLGATPQLGYSVAKWLDAGIVFGYTYISQRDEVDNKYRQSIIGPGVFTRIFPVDFLFVSAQYEHNFIKQKYIPYYGSGTTTDRYDVNSLLLGLGYTSGRSEGTNSYYYFSVSLDVLKNRYSPYVDSYGNLYPIINAGFNIGLFQGASRRR